MQPFGPFGASPFTGDVQIVHPLGGGLTLRYDALSDPRPIVAVETDYTPTSASPQSLEAQLEFDGTAEDPLHFDAPATTSQFRLSVQADATSLDTGRYDWELSLIVHYTDDTGTRVYTGTSEIVNLSDSVFGAGWTVSELDRLVSGTGGMLYVSGTGLTAWFTDNGDDTFTSPAGPLNTFSLVKNVDDTFTLSDKHGNESQYDSAGLLNERIDRNGNSTEFDYVDADSDSETDDLSKVTDPWGRETTFSYTSGLLSSVTDDAGRVTTIDHDASSRLTSITREDPDGAGGPLVSPVTEYAYEGTSFRLSTITDPLDRVTAIGYDFAGRIEDVTYDDEATRSFAAWQTRGLVDQPFQGGNG